MCQKHLIESSIRIFYLSYGKMALKGRVVKQLFKSKKAESWSQVLHFRSKFYLCRAATGVCSWTSLFLVYINDIAEHLLSLTRLFADDSSLFYSAAHIDDIASIINHDMQLLSNKWLVTFNPLKTKAVLFTLKNNYILPQLIFDNIPINFVDSHKDLGVTFSSTGQWHSHIENIVLSATKILGIMRKLKYSISRNALNQMYMSFPLPVLEYVSVVWDRCSEQDSQTLQKIQNEATCLVTGLTRSVSLENLFKECGLTTLSKRRQQHKLSFMYKVNNGIVPSYKQDLIPPLVSEISNYPLRNNRNISVPFNRTSISQKSCNPSSIRLWNSLGDDLKNLSTLQTFKKTLPKDSITHVFLLTLP